MSNRVYRWFANIPASLKLAVGSAVAGAGALWFIKDAEYFEGLLHSSAHGAFMVTLCILTWQFFDRYAMKDINLKMVTDRKLPAAVRAAVVLAYSIFFYGIVYLYASA